MQIDVRGPSGNVFAILGIANGAARQARHFGDPELADKIDRIVGKAKGMKYDAILDALAKTAPGIFEFVGRGWDEEDEEEE